jgi:hypothetical protein
MTLLAEQSMSKKIIASAFAATLFAALSACSQAPTVADIPRGASFTPTILTDGTKLFVYRQRGFGGPPNENEVGPSERAQRGPNTEQMQKMAQRGATAMLMQNHYCREGFMVLEQYEQQRSFVLRGECRDAADASDREKFSPH